MRFFLIISGLSGGIVVGAGVVALLSLVGIVPRLAQVSKSLRYINYYETLLVIGAFLGGIISLGNIELNLNGVVVVISGISYGIFVGMFSSGLAEILEFFPLMTRRLNIPINYIKYIIYALLIGKVIGSFVGWKFI